MTTDHERFVMYQPGVFLGGCLAGKRVPDDALDGRCFWYAFEPIDGSSVRKVEYKALTIIDKKRSTLPYRYFYCGDEKEAESTAMAIHGT